MRITVIGGANVDITAASASRFRPADSNPGRVRLSWGGVGRNIAHNLVLLGDEVRFAGIFGSDPFGALLRESCLTLGIDLSLSEVASGANSCFVSINDADGELVGGIADMALADGMTPEWLSRREAALRESDVVVADTNLPAESLAWLLSYVRVPLFVDAVSCAKALRLKEALRCGGEIHSLKCNRLEDKILADIPGVRRRYVSLGAEGVEVRENGTSAHYPALPCRVVNTTGAGDALFAGIVHAGPCASAEEAVHFGLECARCAAGCEDTVNPQIRNLTL